MGIAWAQTEQTPIADEARQALQRVRPEAIRAHMRFLSADALTGRKPGTTGFDIAANYVQAQLEALGFLPAGDNQTFFQAVPLRKGQVQEAGSSITLIRKNKEQNLTYAIDFSLSPHFGQPSSEVTAPVVFVGFGVSAPELGYDDYKKVDVKGKIVAYFNGAPASFPSAQRAYYSSAKQENAVAHGAVGVISFSLPTDTRNAWNPAAIRAQQGVFKWLDKQGQPQRTYPQLLGVATASDSTAAALFAGAKRTLAEAVLQANQNIPQAFPLPCSLRIRTQTSFMEVAGYNIVAVLPGTDPVLKNEYVVHSAHLDHLGIGRSQQGDSIHNGAHDNASGVAILLETARLYTTLPQPMRRSVLFTVVTGEEMGLLGSDYFASNPTVPGDKIVADLNLDMPFFFHPLLDIVPYGADHSSLAQEVAVAAKALDLQIAPDPIPEQVVFIRSDHFSFVRHGIPALFIKSGFQTGNPQLDGKKVNLDWRAKIYHSPKDDMNQPFDFAAAAKHVQLQFLIGYLVNKADHRPTWNKGDFFGTKFGKAVVKQ
jgi:hypothetical protein